MSEILMMGIDPSLSSTGICFLSQKGYVVHSMSLTHSLEDPERLRYIHESLKSAMFSYNPTHIVYERQVPQMRYAYTAGSIIPLAELAGVLKLAILEYRKVRPEVLVYNIPPEDIKKYATGNPRAEKDSMINAVPPRALKKITSSVLEYSVNDVSDAYHAAKMIIDLLKSDTGILNTNSKTFELQRYQYLPKLP